MSENNENMQPEMYLDEDEQQMDIHTQSPKTEKGEYGLGVTAMILGILSLLLFCVPILGLVLAAVAVVLGIVATAKNNGKKMGTSGIITGCISLCSYFLIFLIFGGIFHTVNKNQDYFTGTAWRRTTDGSVLYLYSDGTFIDVEREGVFTDNFYSGTYDVISYEDSGMNFRDVENQYDTDYAYDVYLYVDTYVSNGVERDSIASTIRYLYLFDKNYSTGEVVEVCAHDATQHGTVYPIKETYMAYPSIGNQYVAVNSADNEEITTELEDETTTEEEKNTTEEEENTTEEEENTTESVSDTQGFEEQTGKETTQTSEAVIGEDTEATTEQSDESGKETFWGDLEDFIDNSKENIEEISSSASEEWEKNSEEINSVVEEASSAMEQASSAMEQASSAMEDASSAVEENIETGGIQKLFERLVKAIQNWLSRWGIE